MTAPNVLQALQQGRAITLRSRVLSEHSEERLLGTMEAVYGYFNRAELAGPLYAAVRELIQNAAKANIKRILFDELGIQPGEVRDYVEAMSIFRKQLNRTHISGYLQAIRARDLFVDVRFEHSPRAVAITISNPFPLYAEEELRIRQKFREAQFADGLYEFYLQHGDQVEGAGMGIAMVLILLQQLGFDPRLFSIHSDAASGRAISRMITPMSDDYESPRRQFHRLCLERDCTPQQLRLAIRGGSVQLARL
ncbi:MAG: hypothetical protein K1X75_09020 [Leptospirales bacterium]|nr:hypothetical protein [Leptospirales bacterium]